MKPLFWLFWTIRMQECTNETMRMQEWAYFQAQVLGHTSRPHLDLWVPFCVLLGVPKWPQNGGKNGIKTCFLVVLDHFPQMNGPNN
jgi:hypothetical protein